MSLRTTSIATTLAEVFGYGEFRPHQAEIIEHLVDGRDSFVLMPTGGGKSLCFQIPALHRPGVAIVVSPLIALMKDQVDALRANGVAAAVLNSSLCAEESASVLRDLRAGALDLLYVAPERLVLDGFLAELSRLELALFAIDEAHCVSQWGHDFRPEYVKLGILRERFPNVPIVALTATADEQTRADVVHQLGLGDARIFVTGFDRPNIHYSSAYKTKPAVQLLEFLRAHQGASGIVYALSRKRVEEVAAKLRAAGFSAGAYHAGMDAAKRTRVQDDFLGDRLDIVVATVAFGMGIDKPDVRFVVHYDMPKSIEGYYQETGRAGRDGLPAAAFMLWSMQDVMTARGFIDAVAKEEQRRIETHKLSAMIAYAEALSCRRRALLGYFGEERADPCGHCDVCENPPETYDATVDAQKALSAVYRLRERFGMGYVVDVLRGSEGERIISNGHDELSVYNIGAEHSKDDWSAIFRQLIHRGYLRVDVAEYSTLKLTPAAGPVLRGEESVVLARPPAPRPKSAEKPAKLPKSAATVLETDEQVALFEHLREVRREIAAEQSVPAYVVFADAALADMARRAPGTREEFLEVSGVGAAKLERYGETFLAAIAAATA
ncbi:MAG: DNA helicase RecQ [Actinobacteria bacterium HGW-Actinobacteria-7]|jgi:ATP-dependent DNA helicase RecQ|nr:MAG: DNA helicase RecQ [Actinobacteria bacterium HGW-Actinobacteria-7]